MRRRTVCLRVLAVLALIAPAAAAPNDAGDIQGYWWPLQQDFAQGEDWYAAGLIERHEGVSYVEGTYRAALYLLGGLEERALQTKSLPPDDLLAAAERGALPEWYRLDLMMSVPMRQRFERAMTLLHDAALHGSRDAQAYLAAAYEAGDRGLPADPDLAECYRNVEPSGKGVDGCIAIEGRKDDRPPIWPARVAAAAASDPMWGSYLGVVEPDDALDRADKEAEQGNVSTQFRLALVLLHGDEWFRLFSTFGYDRPREAMRWLRSAADGGVVGAIRVLASAYRWGRSGLPQDTQVADCFDEAATNSAKEASCRQMEKSKGYDQPAPTAHTVQFVSPLPPALRALALAIYMDDPDVVDDFPDRDQRLKAIEAMGGALVDIDDSGEPAAFFHRDRAVWDCGSIGCDVDVFKKHGRTWQSVGGFPDSADEFDVYDVKDQGVRRLKTYVDRDGRPTGIMWHGKAYKDPSDPDPPGTPIKCASPECP
jgi:TPR repeat protein